MNFFLVNVKKGNNVRRYYPNVYMIIIQERQKNIINFILGRYFHDE